ncbi:hypothetical protein NSQ51_13450 [Geobacillus sp. FSL K6-0789]|uniref:Uncharacterized protein n=3 Tax=root TaxID=1 RepID=A0A3L7D9G7_GEOSE|nr:MULTISPECIES: hypothetical protein [Geobacillus]YP_008240321.1 hypothetical protein N352_gp17 [Thermus phage phi OH2]AEV17640.1 hypothetical protein GTCCBUS3UF5_3140 [Geobacillus thermoleovorans CCB_US3_UF5]MED4333326.1 hypothetical protein [Geobacillus stearothermophilus]MED4995881.1 hypothetical protein [Geobacillus stearothermophilus]OPX04955.1 hypothetical protein B1A75_01490 [Geobacillus sp. LEMMY01]QDY72018.1 hypothetical protein FP515_01680 [Geobacillus thermoleovorans]
MARQTEKSTAEVRYGKSAFLGATEYAKDRLLLEVLLDESRTYTKEEVDTLLSEWKAKEVQ